MCASLFQGKMQDKYVCRNRNRCTGKEEGITGGNLKSQRNSQGLCRGRGENLPMTARRSQQTQPANRTRTAHLCEKGQKRKIFSSAFLGLSPELPSRIVTPVSPSMPSSPNWAVLRTCKWRVFPAEKLLTFNHGVVQKWKYFNKY